jgi:hypothetical protein
MVKLPPVAAPGATVPPVPEDFPRPAATSAVGGYQPKLALVEYDGKFYLPGATPPEVFKRWDICEDLAHQIAEKARESKRGKRKHMSDVDILDQYCGRLLKTAWGSDAEMRWVIRRTAALLDWPAPESASDGN